MRGKGPQRVQPGPRCGSCDGHRVCCAQSHKAPGFRHRPACSVSCVLRFYCSSPTSPLLGRCYNPPTPQVRKLRPAAPSHLPKATEPARAGSLNELHPNQEGRGPGHLIPLTGEGGEGFVADAFVPCLKTKHLRSRVAKRLAAAGGAIRSCARCLPESSASPCAAQARFRSTPCSTLLLWRDWNHSAKIQPCFNMQTQTSRGS